MLRSLGLLLLLSTLLLAASAQSAPLDESANEKIDDAINTHYLATDFKKAEAILLGVVNACGSECSAGVMARAWMYVGIIRGSGRQNQDAARDAFEKAVAADPRVVLDLALATPETQETFNEVAPGGGTTELDEGDVTVASTPQSRPASMECTPAVREVQVGRPIPVSCDSPAGATDLQLAHRVQGSINYDSVLFERQGQLLAATVPCNQTSVPGNVELYVVASDEMGEVVGQWGSPEHPIVMAITEQTSSAPPSLPGQPPPEPCQSIDGGEECPPGFPGCYAEGGGSWGDACTPAEPCKGGFYCDSGTCEAAPACDVNEDCDSGSCTSEGFCEMAGAESGSRSFSRHWLGLHGAFDLFVVSGDRMCTQQGPDDPYRCYYRNTTTPHPSAGRFIEPEENTTSYDSTLTPANARVLLSYDFFATPHISLGARLGYAFDSGAPEFMPFHAEARVAYWFRSIAANGLRPYIHIGGGMAQVTARVDAQHNDRELDAAGNPTGTLINVELDAYQRAGLTFFEGGLGTLIGFGKTHGLLVNANVMYFVATLPGLNLEPSLGYVVGF